MSDELEDWFEVYIKCKPEWSGGDLHQQFADKRGLSRQEGKRLCYKTMYTVPMLKGMMDDIQALEGVFNALQDSSCNDQY